MQTNRIDWQAIDTVLFDMDGTLLDLHFDNHFWLEHLPQRVSELRALPLDEVASGLMARMQEVRGTLAWYSTDYWSDHLGVDVMTLKHETAERVGYRNGSLELLDALKSSDKAIALVTNADPHVVALKTGRTGVADHFETIVSSHDLGHPKEAQDFWHRLDDHIAWDPARTLLIDDSVGVLQSAATFGIGWLRAPLQPDSQKPAVDDHEFATIARFEDLLPVI